MESYDPGLFYGAGFGLGVFSSVFVCAGCAVLNQLCKECRKIQECRNTFGYPLIMVCMMPFPCAPLVIGVVFWNWFIPVVGYVVPIIAVLCKKSNIKCSCKNPMYRDERQQKSGAADKRIKFAKKTQSYNSMKPKRNLVVWEWLSPLGLTKYHDVLVRGGYGTWKDLQSVTEEDLRGLGITRQFHVHKILKKIEDEKNTEAGTGTNIVHGESEGYSAINVNVIQPGSNDDACTPPAYDASAPPAYDDVTVF